LIGEDAGNPNGGFRMWTAQHETAARRNVTPESPHNPQPDQVPDDQRTGDEPNPSG